MASPSGSRDRLSELPDFLLGHVLSYLPTKAAGRAAGLSRRWRDIFSNVQTISFGEREGARASDWTTFYYEANTTGKSCFPSCSAALLDDVWSAILCRRRCAGANVPLRSLQVAFDSCNGWDRCHVDQWLSCVLRHSSQELHLDLTFRLGPICPHANDRDMLGRGRGGGWYDLPRNLLCCTAIRSLCLAYCTLNLPEVINLPSLETLRLTGVRCSSEAGVQRLIASCPRLVDLALEANLGVDKVSVLDRRLRRFALRCCHDVDSVDIDASELMALDYCGTVPAESLLSLHGIPAIIQSCTVDFCRVLSGEAEFAGFKRFMEKISGAKQVRLHHRRLPARSFEGFPSFPNLTRLGLQGPLQSPDVVRQILEQTPNLEILSLFMVPDEFNTRDEPTLSIPDEFIAPDESSFSDIPCLQNRVREINMVHYEGNKLQSAMAKLLFRNALLLERYCVVLVKGPFALQDGLKKEIQSWVVAAHAEPIFL
ncbi:hypothetical protein VPH35_031829 [Triticum aestivum]